MCNIGNKLKNRRLDLGLTLEDVGQAVGVGRSTVQRWESGLIKNMGRDKIASLARVLKMNPVELVPYSDLEQSTYGEVFEVSDEDQQRLEALHQDPRLGILFDHTRKMKKEDVDFMIQMAERMIQERDRDE